MAADEFWIAAIHEGLLIALGAAIAECSRSKGGDPLAGVRETREAVDKSVAWIKLTGTRQSGAKDDLAPELRKRMKKLLDIAEQQALRELDLTSEGKQVQ